MDKLIMIFLFYSCLTIMNCQLNSQWNTIYNGIHEARNINCLNVNCIYGFKEFLTGSSAVFVNCSSSPQTAIVLNDSQMSVIQNLTSLTPSAPNAYKLLLIDVYFTTLWTGDEIKISYDNYDYHVLYTTNNPLQFQEGLCDLIEFEIKTFYFILPYTSNTPTYLILQIFNPSIQALIRNVHVGFLSCYPKCLQCTGPNQGDCQVWDVIYSRCPIRQSILSNGVCVDHCPIQGSIVKSQNRICVGFQHTLFFQSNLATLNLNTLLNWNVLYDPQHYDVSNKKLSPFNFGVFRFREGAYMAANINSGNYTIGVQIQLIFCNPTPLGSGVSFYINSTYYGSTYFDGTQFKYHNVILRNIGSHPNIGSCTNNQFMDLEMFYHIFDKKFIFSIQGNFTQPNAGWILRLFSLTSGYCPANCILCNQRFKCQTCANGFFKLADATCQWGCPQERINNGYNCIQYDQVTKYSKFLIREFYDLTVKDTLNATFILESSSTIDFQKGSDIFWSYLTNKIIFGGKFVWAQSRFSQIYTLDPHHSLTIYFQVIFGPNFPNSISNYLSYEINNGTINKITKTSSLNIVEQILTYNPTLTIAIQCYGINVIDSYCGISNYYIVVHYCKPYCYRCSNELTCDQWMPYDPNIIKVEQSQCQSNQFLDETTSTCEYCPNECLTCFNEYECLTCKSNYKLVITTCILDCQLNQYYDGVNCLDCNYSCRQCQSINYCIHCESTSLRYLQDGQCLCYDGYYDQINIQQCQPCDKLCAKCNGPTNKNCQSCIILNNLIKTGNTCECSIGYYFDEFKLKCLKCSDKCETCFNFSNTSCLSCYSIQFRIIDGLNCKCQNGYYDDNSDICIQCPFLEDSLLQQCYKICGDNSIIWFNSNCPFVICGNGYNNVNNQCLPICGDLIIVAEEDCDDGNSIQFDGCHNCRFQCPAQCTTCNSITQFPCSDVCGDGIVSGLEECDDSHPIQLDSCYQCKFQCQPQCTRCNRGVCQNCLNFGWVLEPYTRRCIETCGDSYQVGNEQCEEMNTRMLDGCYNCQQSCQKSCLTCTINGCNQCEVGYQLINRYCRNICGDSLVVDGEDCDDGNLYPFDTCHQCVYQCQSECLNCQQGSCLFCIDGFIAFDGECVEIQKIPIIPSNEYYQHDLIEFCKIKVNGICYECQKNYKLNNLYNTCELEERKEIIKIESFEVLPQFIQYCQFQLNNLCIICYKNFGLDIFTNLCEPICGDGILTGIEECEDNNHQILDGCYECMHQCNEYCEICEFGKCILCHLNTIYVPAIFQCEILQQCTQPGSYYNEEINKCYSICGDGFIYQKEQCDDGNDIKFDGCHNCQYSCAPGYTVINGECIKEQIDCKEGLYYSFTSLSCKPQCGDGVVIQPYEECDDGNEVINDECHSCKLQCSIHCQECSIQNLCLKCKEGYELIDFKCENLNNSLCYTNNCKLCENYECFTCINGYYLYDNECIPECGDGILANLEECDDGNLINGDGCDDNCIISENALCRNNECAVLRYPQPILEFDKEILGVQYVNLRYSSKMRLLDGVTQKEYLDNLFFEIQDQPEIALFQIIVKQKITMQLQFIDIQVSVKFLEFVKNPFIQLKFLEKNNLVDEYGAGILEDSIKIKLRSSNVLDIQSQKISDSLTGINDYMMKFLIILMIIATISGQSEIISNLLDIIQQLYYLKYINSRIGVNLEKFFDIFAIIQLNDIFDLLNDQTNLFSFYHSEPIFETDDRNANYLVNIVSLLQVYFNYISHSFCQKLSLLVYQKNCRN